MTHNNENNAANATIDDRQRKEKESLLSHLRKTPIIQVACERSGIGRTTYYRWRHDDKEFAKRADEAMLEGEHLITDLTEAQLINLIKEKNWPAMHLWLKAHHPKYGNKVEVSGTISARTVKDFSNEEKEALQKEFSKLFEQIVDTGYKPRIPSNGKST